MGLTQPCHLEEILFAWFDCSFSCGTLSVMTSQVSHIIHALAICQYLSENFDTCLKQKLQNYVLWLYMFGCYLVVSFFFWQVLFLLEPIDEVAVTNLHTFKQKMFVDVSKEGLELGKLIDNIKL